MASTSGASETWQARITRELAAQLRDDAELLGLDSRTKIVRAALELLHPRAAEERMARNVNAFYAGREPALPVGVGLPAAARTPMSLPEPFSRRGPGCRRRLGAASDQTHVPHGRDVGLTRYAESFADVTGLQPVAEVGCSSVGDSSRRPNSNTWRAS